jgi:hypothetical protein
VEEADRRFRVFIHDVSGGTPHDVIVSVTRQQVESAVVLDTSRTGELPVIEEEFELVETLLATDERWLKALAARDLEVEKVRVAPLSAGVFEYTEDPGRRDPVRRLRIPSGLIIAIPAERPSCAIRLTSQPLGHMDNWRDEHGARQALATIAAENCRLPPRLLSPEKCGICARLDKPATGRKGVFCRQGRP